MMLKALVLSVLSTAAYGQNLITALGSNSQLSQLAALVNAQPQLVAAIGNITNITLLAPSNAALGALLNSSSGAALASNPAAVAALLSYHVLNGTYPASGFTNRTTFFPTLLNNNPAYANVTGGQRVQGLTVSGNVTFFSGLNQNSTVSQANQNFTGGVIHVINRALTIPPKVSNTLVEGRLTALWGALNKTGLLNTVDGLKDVTIFAPNNSGFAAVGSAVANLSNTDLSKILTYHVVNGSRPGYSTTLTNGTSLPTLNGGNITVRISNGTYLINGARVITPDVLIGGGVVHIIDQVLNPANTTASGPAFPGASSVSNIPFTAGAPTPSATFGSGPGSRSTSAATSTSKAAAQPMRTGAVGAAVLFGAGAVFANL